MPPGPTAPRAPSAPRVALLGALALTAVAYARSLRGEFQFDDRTAIVVNPAVKHLADFLAHGFWAELRGAGRPVTTLTFALDYALAGLSPLAFHLTNVAIHLGVVLLVFAFTRRVLRLAGAAGAEGVAAAVAAIFALHPIQTEAVSYLAQRSEALASGLYLSTLLLLLRADEEGFRGRGLRAYGGAVVAFAVGLATKAIVVTAPVAYAALVLAVPSREERARLAPWRRRLGALAQLGALALGMAALTLRSVRGSTNAGFSTAIAPWQYPLTEVRAIARYLRLIAWPAGLSADPDFPPSTSVAEPAVLASGALLVALLTAAVALVRAGRRSDGPGAAAARVAGFGVGWFFLVLSVTSSVVPLADPLAEHRVYLAAWGVVAAVAVGLERLAAPSRWPGARGALLAAAGASCLVLGAATWARNAVWETSLAFWSDAVAKAPARARPRQGLAVAIATGGDLEGGIRELRTALALARGIDAPQRMPILAQLGGALVLAGRFAEADEVLRVAVEESPRDATTLGNAATARLRLGDLDGAYRLALRANAADPSQAGPLATIGEVLLRAGRPGEALEWVDRAIRLDPDRPIQLLERGMVLGAMGRTADACATLARVAGLASQVGRDARGISARIGCGPPATAAGPAR